VPDRTFLQWPFFDEKHREFAGRFSLWVAMQTRADEADPDGAARRWVRALAEGGWLRACLDLDVRTLCLARELLAYQDPFGDFAFAMQGLGSAPIVLYGTGAQKHVFLSAVTSGESIMAFALSEREAGSDVAACAATARRDRDSYVLNGEKFWISNAGIADVYVVFARTGGEGAKGLSAFVVPAETPGVGSDCRIRTISPHPLGNLRLHDVRIPSAYRIGEEGEGFKIAMATLDVFRPCVGASAIGLSRRAADECVAHVHTRKLFGSTLGSLQLTQSAIAQMALDIDAGALLVYRAAYAKDRGAPRITREAAMAKLFATEAAGRIADRAVQLFGGRGVTQGEVVERIYRDVRALRIYEGASEIQQLVIARSVLEE
jgi:acyl-CoA dehydrogenase